VTRKQGWGAKVRGGARKGAGRPPIDPQRLKIPVGYRLPRWLVEKLREADQPAAIQIEAALRLMKGWKPPS